MEPSKINRWISRADHLSNQLRRPSDNSSSIETILFLRAARECASEVSSYLMHATTGTANQGGESGTSTVLFADILRLQQAKNALVHAINASASTQHSVGSTISKLHVASSQNGGGNNASSSELQAERHQRASDEELQTLLRVRGLLAAENMKMDSVIASISEGSSALQALHARLEEVDATLTLTQSIVKGMLRVKTVDDLVLRVSWVLFFVVVCFVWSQRLFGLGAVSVL